MNLAERVSILRQANGLSARQLAALVDVAPTTVTRIESGAVSPSFHLAQELLAVLGEAIGSTAGADSDAIKAVRLALSPSLPIEVTPAVTSWWSRWARIGLVDDAGSVSPNQRARLLARAATTARLTHRAGATAFLPGPSAAEVAARLETASIACAVTGDSAANLYSSSAGEVWPVLYVADVERAATAVGLTPRLPGTYGSRVTLIPFDGVSELGRENVEHVTVAALDQVILDCLGGTGRMAEQADILLGRRVS